MSNPGKADIPYSVKVDPTYENFCAACPHCDEWNVFNRASDLKTFRGISFREVKCLNCGRPFNINGDVANPAHQMLLFDCYDLIQRKHYMQCVLCVAQAYEVFFSHFLHVQLVFRPYAKEGCWEIARLNELAAKLYREIHRHTFNKMRGHFLALIVTGAAPSTLAEAETIIAGLGTNPREPSITEIETVVDEKLRNLLLRLKATTVNETRNRVVHKHAYRPTYEEANVAHDEAEEILHGLTYLLRLKGDLNWYIQGEDR